METRLPIEERVGELSEKHVQALKLDYPNGTASTDDIFIDLRIYAQNTNPLVHTNLKCHAFDFVSDDLVIMTHNFVWNTDGPMSGPYFYYDPVVLAEIVNRINLIRNIDDQTLITTVSRSEFQR